MQVCDLSTSCASGATIPCATLSSDRTLFPTHNEFAPQRRAVRPHQPKFAGGQWRNAQELSDRLAARQPGGLTAQQVTCRQVAMGSGIDRPGDFLGQPYQASDPASGDKGMVGRSISLRGMAGGPAIVGSKWITVTTRHPPQARARPRRTRWSATRAWDRRRRWRHGRPPRGGGPSRRARAGRVRRIRPAGCAGPPGSGPSSKIFQRLCPVWPGRFVD